MNQLTYSFNHVLIIDDSKEDIFILKDILNSHQFAEYLSTFDNSVSALNFLKKCKPFPDVIFIDINMPGINGFEFIKRFMNEFSAPTKFVITSCSDDQKDIDMSTSLGNVIHYFTKPINMNNVALLVDGK
jgi:two-component SAPR family response regulator